MNLVDDPWIPVLAAAGPTEMGLREVFASAGEIAAVASGESVLVDAGLLRLLLAVDAAADGDPVGWLDAHRNRFELFDPVAPFWQNPNLAEFWDLPGAGSPMTVLARPNFSAETIVHSVTSAMGTVRPAPMEPACAARYLVMRQQFSTGGIQSFPMAKAYPAEMRAKTVTTSAKLSVATVAPLVFVQGRTLADTLAANRWPDAGGPFQFTWPEGALPCAPGTPVGVIDTLTWQSRSLLLRRGQGGMVTSFMCCDGIRYGDLIPELLPHTSFEKVKVDAPWTVRSVSYQRPGWRQLLDAYAAGGPGLLSSLPAVSGRVRIMGLSSFQSRIDGVVDDSIPIPVIGPDEAAQLSAALVDAYREAGSVAGSAGAVLGLADWAARHRDLATTGLARSARPRIEDALAGRTSVAEASEEIMGVGYRSARTLATQLAAADPALAGRLAARTNRRESTSKNGTR